MKKILLIIVLLLIGATLSGQQYYEEDKEKNALYLIIQPTDMGVGLRYDRIIDDKFGAYGSFSGGEYYLEDGGYVRNHYKLSFGGMMTAKSFFPDTYLSAGLTFHNYGKSYFPNQPPKRTLSPMSFELGVSTVLGGVSVGFRMDVPKWESSIDVGFTF